MISGLFVFGQKGEAIISRTYRDDILAEHIQTAFKVSIIHSRTGVRSPINTIAKQHYFHVYRSNLYLVAVTCVNANAAMIFEFLRKFLELCDAYFEWNEVNVKKYFPLIYELLDEVLDNGYPQSTDPAVLKIITDEAKKGGTTEDAKQISSQVTGQIGWRRAGIKYKKHEVFLDVVEKVNCLFSPSGQVLNQAVVGTIQMKCLLSGMPECQFAVNDKLSFSGKKSAAEDDSKKKKKNSNKKQIEIDDLTFHQCVQLGGFNKDRKISFVPPDGEFDLIKYRTTQGVNLPFIVKPIMTEYGDSMELIVSIKGQFDPQQVANGIEVIIPVPTSAASVSVKTKSGKAKYKAGANLVKWKMRTFAGGKSAKCEVKIALLKVTGKNKWTRPPIQLSFEAPFSCSGLIVEYLAISERIEQYTQESVAKWVRYISSNSDYEARY